jgi:hypothetical protein
LSSLFSFCVSLLLLSSVSFHFLLVCLSGIITKS